MLEYSSVQVTSYDAASLTDQLNQQAKDGWDVVGIVTAATNVVAFLSREVSDATATATISTAETAEIEPLAPQSAAPEPAPTEPAAAEESSPEPAALKPTGTSAAGWGASETAETPTSETTPAAATVPSDTSSSSDPAAPADWYADPAGRFELRYWNGEQWTEHVSRAGQQFTDPPVA